MTIKILGMGCPSCKLLYKITRDSVKELKLDCQIEYITDIKKIVRLGVIKTPALAIDDKIIVSGYIPKSNELKNLIDKNCKEA